MGTERSKSISTTSFLLFLFYYYYTVFTIFIYNSFKKKKKKIKGKHPWTNNRSQYNHKSQSHNHRIITWVTAQTKQKAKKKPTKKERKLANNTDEKRFDSVCVFFFYFFLFFLCFVFFVLTNEKLTGSNYFTFFT